MDLSTSRFVAIQTARRPRIGEYCPPWQQRICEELPLFLENDQILSQVMREFSCKIQSDPERKDFIAVITSMILFLATSIVRAPEWTDIIQRSKDVYHIGEPYMQKAGPLTKADKAKKKATMFTESILISNPFLKHKLLVKVRLNPRFLSSQKIPIWYGGVIIFKYIDSQGDKVDVFKPIDFNNRIKQTRGFQEIRWCICNGYQHPPTPLGTFSIEKVNRTMVNGIVKYFPLPLSLALPPACSMEQNQEVQELPKKMDVNDPHLVEDPTSPGNYVYDYSKC